MCPKRQTQVWCLTAGDVRRDGCQTIVWWWEDTRGLDLFKNVSLKETHLKHISTSCYWLSLCTVGLISYPSTNVFKPNSPWDIKHFSYWWLVSIRPADKYPYRSGLLLPHYFALCDWLLHYLWMYKLKYADSVSCKKSFCAHVIEINLLYIWPSAIKVILIKERMRQWSARGE